MLFSDRFAGSEEQLASTPSRWRRMLAAADEMLLIIMQLAGGGRALGLLRATGRTIAIAWLGHTDYTVRLGDRVLLVRCRARASRARRLLAELFDQVQDASPTNGDLADLEVREVTALSSPGYERHGWTLIPDVVRWFGDLAEIPPDPPPRSLASNLRKVSPAGFTPEVSSRPSDWSEFWSTMVVPYALRRFGSSAWHPSPVLRHVLQRRGELLFVRRDGRRVAGICRLAGARGVWIAVLGVRDGDVGEVQRGALVALTLAAFEWSRRMGYRRVDMGRTKPLVNDGIVHVKRSWGLRPHRDPLGDAVAVRARDPSLLAELLHRVPLYMLREGKLAEPVGTAGCDEQTRQRR